MRPPKDLNPVCEDGDEAFSRDPSFLGKSNILPDGMENLAGLWPTRTGFEHPSVSDHAAKVQHPLRHLRFADSDCRNTLEMAFVTSPNSSSHIVTHQSLWVLGKGRY